jgi:hypothetical protein
MCNTNFIRPYDSSIYLVIPQKTFTYIRGVTNLSYRVFVYRKDNLFGDPTPLELAGLSIQGKLINQNGLQTIIFPVNISNLDNSEIEVNWDNIIIENSGVYYLEFIFKELDLSTFVLPLPPDRIQITVK